MTEADTLGVLIVCILIFIWAWLQRRKHKQEQMTNDDTIVQMHVPTYEELRQENRRLREKLYYISVQANDLVRILERNRHD